MQNHTEIRHLGTLVSNKSRIQPFCAVVEISITLQDSKVNVLDPLREVKLLPWYSVFHFNDPEIFIAICQHVLQLDHVLFLPCPKDSPGSWSDEGAGSWVAHDGKSVQRAENVNKHVSTGRLQPHFFIFFLPACKTADDVSPQHVGTTWSPDALTLDEVSLTKSILKLICSPAWRFDHVFFQ